jgi:hypothetical protein
VIRLPTAELGAAEAWPASLARYELKFLGAAHEAGVAAERLRGVCLPDPEFPANVVHSVYFDTARLRSFQEKTDGEYRKAKLRLRWYDVGYRSAGPESGPWIAWLEVKVREGTRGFKFRKRLRLQGPSPLAGLPPDELAAVAQAHLGSPLRPTCWLAYTRTRLRGPDGLARVSVDRDIRLLWTAGWLAAVPRADRPLPVFVVEVKGPSPVAHPVLTAVVGRHARKRSVSKYALCLEHARGGAS